MNLNKVKYQVYINLEPSAKSGKLSLASKVICFFIFLSFINAIFVTENSLASEYKDYFAFCEQIFFDVFLVEYILRLWTCDINETYKKYKYKRLKYIISFYPILDLLTLMIFVVPYITASPAFLRILRLIKILRILKFGRFSIAISRLKYALRSRVPDLTLVLLMLITFTIFVSAIFYFLEGDINHKDFGSIPRAMWAAVTITTVGFGEVYPSTVAGKILASVLSIIGLALIAMPGGIFAAAFSDAMRIERRAARKNQAKKEKKEKKELSEKMLKKEKNT